MLEVLRIRNLAIIESLELSFSKGLNILTGETGAGKSIILNAVHLLLGDRISEDVVRTSEEEGSVEAVFDICHNNTVREKIEARGLEPSGCGDPNRLLVRRVISRSGRGRTYINGNLATMGVLAEIAEDLLSIYGQHEHQSLQRVETHLEFLDAFGDLTKLREAFQDRFERFVSLSEEVERRRREREQRAKERELMAFQSREIEAAGIRLGEDEALQQERRVLRFAEKLLEFAQTSESRLYGEEGSVIERLQTILYQGRELSRIDPSLCEPLKTLEGVLAQVEEIALSFREYGRRLEVDPERLEAVESRLEAIDRFKRKYGPTIEAILLYKERVDEALRSFDVDEGHLGELEALLSPLEKEMLDVAQSLSTSRRRVAENLKRLIERELASLGMKKTTFEVLIENAALTAKGMDRVEFLISPNVGEPVKPLAKIASGGELSRIMLAMKRILANVGARQVLIFDEIDSGVGGATAEVVGRKLKELSKEHQIICVTHLPQIACFADLHHSVRKESRSGRTLTRVERLEGEAVVDEIARMLGGLKITERTRAHAREMIENARRS